MSTTLLLIGIIYLIFSICVKNTSRKKNVIWAVIWLILLIINKNNAASLDAEMEEYRSFFRSLQSTSRSEQTESITFPTFAFKDETDQFISVGETIWVAVVAEDDSLLDNVILDVSETGIIEYSTWLSRYQEKHYWFEITGIKEGEVTIKASTGDRKHTTKDIIINVSDSNLSTIPQPDNVTLGMQNALETAKQYLDYSAFSYTGLIEQLEYEKYSHDEAVYAVDHCGADWYEQAVKCGQQYLDYSAFSREGLIEQLEYEGFTNDQAVYAVTELGY